MTTNAIRTNYLECFARKKHSIVPSSSLIPENDPTTLFTGSGMQPMISYLLGAPHPKGNRIANSQKSFRAQDIEEVGDNRHTTFFEMLGNWSLGDYFKKEQIPWIFEFLTENVGLDPHRLYVTCFRGNSSIGIPKDEESVEIWQAVFANAGMKAEIVDSPEARGMQNGRIFYYDETKNWWSRSGVPTNMPTGEPGGPDSEIFWDFGAERLLHECSPFKDKPCHVNCDCGRFLEIGNSVFMEYVKTDAGFEKLSQRNVDFGGGLERITAASNNDPDVFKIDLFNSIVKRLEELSGISYGSDRSDKQKSFRVVADHIRGAIFMVADGVRPSNTERGYFVRRLLRRAARYADILGIKVGMLSSLVQPLVKNYGDAYPDVVNNKALIEETIEGEESKFRETLKDGLAALKKIYGRAIGGVDPDNLPPGMVVKNNIIRVDGNEVFRIYETYGLPPEVSQEIMTDWGLKFSQDTMRECHETFKRHQVLSRAGSEKKFKGGLADHTESTTRLHSATHLLNEALRVVVDPNIRQRGSNITQERLRFDFNLNRKLTDDEIKKVERLINEKIAAGISVTKQEMPLAEALASGAQSEFGAQYPDTVTVYAIGDFSKEICGGPHVENTSALGKLKVIKEESCGSGRRRIKAILQ